MSTWYCIDQDSPPIMNGRMEPWQQRECCITRDADGYQLCFPGHLTETRFVPEPNAGALLICGLLLLAWLRRLRR